MGTFGMIIIFLVILLITKEVVKFHSVSDFSNTREWVKYANPNYGYEISYPKSDEFITSMRFEHTEAQRNRKDQSFFIHSKSIYMITAGAPVIGYTATNTKQLKDLYVKHTIPRSIDDINRSAESEVKPNVVADDFVINEITHNGRPAIEVFGPPDFSGYGIYTFNNSGKIFSVTALYYSGGTTTLKDRNTRAIMETFRVLD